jgi:hypothetical protein
MIEMHDVCREFLELLQKQIDGRINIKRKERSRWWQVLPEPFLSLNTTLGWTLWLRPSSKVLNNPANGLALLVHEAEHWRQRKILGRLEFLFKYLRKSSRLELEVSSYSIEWAYTRYILLRELPNQVDLNGTYRLQYAERLVTILSRAPYYLRYSSRKQMLKIVLNAMERKEKEINIPKGTTLLIAAKICTGLE